GSIECLDARGTDGSEAQAAGARVGVQGVEDVLDDRVVWVPYERGPREPGQGLQQELEQFGPIDSPVEESCEVSAGARDALGKSHGDGVATYADADDRNRSGRGLRLSSAGHASCDDNVNVELD